MVKTNLTHILLRIILAGPVVIVFSPGCFVYVNDTGKMTF
jgi:hypothetical protein